MTTPRTDALSVIRRMPYGTALYGREQIDSGAWEVVWYLREEQARVTALGPSPEIEVRIGYIERDSVLLIPIVVRVGPEKQDHLWETWLNKCQPEAAGRITLGELAIQPRLVVHFVDREVVRSLTRSNPLQAFARQILEKLGTVTPWSMADFDSARERYYQDVPSVLDLWYSLGRL